ncbi:hypothetical protein JCM19238_3275 [Vibrio ponticus]|nr:hypothetical protein JCM19238_3275 [Vibrio ponticus]
MAFLLSREQNLSLKMALNSFWIMGGQTLVAETNKVSEH